MKKRSTLAVFAILLASSPAFAHQWAGHGAGYGLLHPFSGLDHLSAMVAVGLWAAQLGGAAQWRIPAAFLVAMLAGTLLRIAGWDIPYVEAGIAASLLVLGLLLAMAQRLSTVVAMALTAVFALFHGHAHGSEIPTAMAQASYILGFMLSTAALHGLGLGLGWLLCRRGEVVLRLGGWTMAAGGAWLVFS